MAIRKRNTFFILLAATLLLAGCVMREGEPVSTVPTPTPEPVTAASLLEKVSAAVLQKGSAEASVEGSMSYMLLAADGWRDTSAELTLTGESVCSPRVLHAQGSAHVKAVGMDMDLPVELYTVEDASGAAICLRVLDEWTKQSAGRAGSDTGSSLALLQRAAVLNEYTEPLAGHTCYRLDIPVTAQMLAEATGGLSLSAPEDGPELTATLWADAQSFLPVRLRLTLTKPMVSETMTLRELELTLHYTAFGTVDSLTPPPEAMYAPEKGA